MSDSFSRADKTQFSKRLKVKFNIMISAHARKCEPQSAAVAVKIFFMQHQRPSLIDWPSFAVAGESLAVCFHTESYRYNMQYSAIKCLETTKHLDLSDVFEATLCFITLRMREERWRAWLYVVWIKLQYVTSSLNFLFCVSEEDWFS